LSCLHIQGTRRAVTGCPPFRFTGKRDRVFEVEQNAKHENPKVRATAAASPYATPAVFHLLTFDTVPEVREWVARNTKAPEQALWTLSEDVEPRVRAFVAWNPNSPLDLVKFMCQDVDETVRLMAQNVLDNLA
jgi:hypothetical protein